MRVLLFPEEGWARSASSSYWTLTPSWWSSSRCQVVEVAGTRSPLEPSPGDFGYHIITEKSLWIPTILMSFYFHLTSPTLISRGVLGNRKEKSVVRWSKT
uniref:Uncharacterized protein n=1 Tax=Timema shepardi TaxID=629360 RepID=A0A7R9AQM4_TIMSH|nr:unnamed protein product [Timema shepardi]